MIKTCQKGLFLHRDLTSQAAGWRISLRVPENRAWFCLCLPVMIFSDFPAVFAEVHLDWSIVNVQRGYSCHSMPQRTTEVDFAASASLQIHFCRVSPLLMGGLKEWRSSFADFLSYTQQQSQFLTNHLKPAGSRPHKLDQQGQEQWFPTGGLRARSGSYNRSGRVTNSWS